jgi:hypothetical protein
MAKKLTSRQRQTRKRASYYRSEYKKNVEAIQFLQRFGVDVPTIKTPQKITKSSLKSIRKKYKQTRSYVRKVNKYGGLYVDITTGEIFEKLPSKEQASKTYREEQQQGLSTFNPDEQYIQELKDKINALAPLRDSDKTERNYQKNVVPKQQQVKANFIQAIDDAIAKYGADKVAETLSRNQYMQRIGNLEEKYTYQIIEDITDGDDGLMVLMDASVDKALLTIKTE